MIEVYTLTSDYMESNIYLICESGHAIIIDPADDLLIRNAVKKAECIVDTCILTHEHCDHTCCCENIRNEYNCDVIASETCAMNLNDGRMNFINYFGALVALQEGVNRTKQKSIQPYYAKASRTFRDTTRIEWQGHDIILKETPGHSPGSICIVVDHDLLFTGDTLFAERETIFRFNGGSRRAFEEITFPWLMSLPSELMVYPGHGRPFRLNEKIKEKDNE